jgi:hypothetical protein
MELNGSINPCRESIKILNSNGPPLDAITSLGANISTGLLRTDPEMAHEPKNLFPGAL